MKILCKLVFLLFAPFTGMTAAAQVLADPTRPPAAMSAPGEAASYGGPVLQSVMLSPGRKLAMISGEMVLLGGKYGTARLVRLTENEAVLKSGAETTVLRLHPQVDKRMTGHAGGTAKNNAAITKK